MQVKRKQGSPRTVTAGNMIISKVSKRTKRPPERRVETSPGTGSSDTDKRGRSRAARRQKESIPRQNLVSLGRKYIESKAECERRMVELEDRCNQRVQEAKHDLTAERTKTIKLEIELQRMSEECAKARTSTAMRTASAQGLTTDSLLAHTQYEEVVAERDTLKVKLKSTMEELRSCKADNATICTIARCEYTFLAKEVDSDIWRLQI